MAARKRKKSKSRRSSTLEYRQLATDTLYRRIEEARKAGKLSTAIGMAKECRRRADHAEHTRLLGELYVERGQQLIGKQLYPEALMVLNNALDLGHGSAQLLQMIFECGLHARQYASAFSALSGLDDPSDRLRASSFLVDEVLSAGEPLEAKCQPEIRDGVQRIRRAFDAFEKGDLQTAADELKPIGLSHPCAGWKWLLLGLIAYLRGERDRALASWDRIQGNPRAKRLATLLRCALSPDETARSTISPELRAKVTERFQNQRVVLLKRIKSALEAEECDRALKLCNKLLSTIDVREREAYARRLARVVFPFMIEKPGFARPFRRVFGDLAEDPELIRTAAISLEHKSPLAAIELWHDFLDTLNEVKAILPRQRKRARAMIWQRMGDLAADGSHPGMPFGISLYDSEYLDGDAAECYRKSLEYEPADLKTHEKLLDLLVHEGRLKQAERQAREILQRWPSHTASLLLLGAAAQQRKAFRKALGYFDRARRAAPFDDRIRDEMKQCYLLSARRRLDQGKLELAREDYRQAETLCEPGDSSSSVHCKWAALEWKAGNANEAESLLERALTGGSPRVAVLLQLIIELERAGIGSQVRRRFEDELAREWQNPPNAEAAASMVSLMLALESMDVRYPGRPAHDRALVEYLKRLEDEAEFNEVQLLAVCTYLDNREAHRTLERLADQGTQRFPSNYHFPLLLAQARFYRGQRKLSQKTRQLLNRAGKLAAQAGDIEAATEIASMLSGAGPWYDTQGLLDMLGALGPPEELMDEEWSPPPPRSGGRRRKRRKSRREPDPRLPFEEVAESIGEA